MSPQDLAAAYLALSSADRGMFARTVGLASSAHSGARRTKGALTDASRRVAYAREGYRCFWCSADLTEVGAHLDHLIRVRNVTAWEDAAGMQAPKAMQLRGEMAQYAIFVASCGPCNQTRPADGSDRRAALRRIASVDYTSILQRAGWAGATGDAEDAAAFAAVKRASGGGKPQGPARGDF